jgi:hypothetical protein
VYFNLIIAQVPSLIVSIVLLAEPLVGSVLGWAVGKQANPGVFTWVGGVVLLAGASAVVYAQERQPHAEAAVTDEALEGSQEEASGSDEAVGWSQEHASLTSPVRDGPRAVH